MKIFAYYFPVVLNTYPCENLCSQINYFQVFFFLFLFLTNASLKWASFVPWMTWIDEASFNLTDIHVGIKDMHLTGVFLCVYMHNAYEFVHVDSVPPETKRGK